MKGFVVINPRICNGKPVIAGTRIPLAVLIGQLIAVQSIEQGKPSSEICCGTKRQASV